MQSGILDEAFGYEWGRWLRLAIAASMWTLAFPGHPSDQIRFGPFIYVGATKASTFWYDRDSVDLIGKDIRTPTLVQNTSIEGNFTNGESGTLKLLVYKVELNCLDGTYKEVEIRHFNSFFGWGRNLYTDRASTHLSHKLLFPADGRTTEIHTFLIWFALSPAGLRSI